MAVWSTLALGSPSSPIAAAPWWLGASGWLQSFNCMWLLLCTEVLCWEHETREKKTLECNEVGLWMGYVLSWKCYMSLVKTKSVLWSEMRFLSRVRQEKKQPATPTFSLTFQLHHSSPSLARCLSISLISWVEAAACSHYARKSILGNYKHCCFSVTC